MKRLIIAVTGCALAAWLATPALAQRRAHVGASSSARIGMSARAAGAQIDHSSSASARTGAEARTNKGGELRGLERAEAAQSTNTRADVNRGFTVAPGVEKAETKHAAKESAEHHPNAAPAKKQEKRQIGVTTATKTHAETSTSAGAEK